MTDKTKELMKAMGFFNSSSPKDYVEDFEHENGFYQNLCYVCTSTFMGHKRRVICKECSEKPPAKTVKKEEN